MIRLMSVLALSGLALAKDPASPKGPARTDFKGKPLSSLEYEVTQKGGTETPFSNTYWNNHQDGIYVDVVTGEALFSSLDKYDSGTGWPSFTQPIPGGRLAMKQDTSLGLERTEVKSAGGSHLGHVFKDGPGPKGERFCINSASLRFVPLAKLEAEGYGKFKALFDKPAPKKH